MKQIAKALAAQGRNGDTHLLHVSETELRALRGLGSLTGHNLSTNPHTGLPEAFNFTSLIPAIVGIGATVMSGGTLSPLMAGLISGATTTAVTGDYRKGLMAGVTGGMASGLGAGLSEMGSTAAGSQAAGSAAMDAAGSQAAGSAAAPHFSDAAFDAGSQTAASGMGNAVSPHFSDAAFDAGSQTAASGVASSPTAMSTAGQSAVPTVATSQPGFSMDAFQQNMSNPDAWESAFGGKNMMSRTIPGGLALAGSISDGMRPDFKVHKEEASDEANKEHHMDRDYYGTPDSHYPISGSEPMMFSAPRFYAAGGPVRADSGIASLPPYMQDSGTLKTIRALRSRYRSKKQAQQDTRVDGSYAQSLGITDPNDPLLEYAFGYTATQGKKKDPTDGMVPAFADGGGVELTGLKIKDRKTFMDEPQDKEVALRQQSTGGMPVLSDEGIRRIRVVVPPPPKQMASGGRVVGLGDGMSDSVPATIEGSQPARLARDEFVVPADVVSHLGNGSSNAGAQHLYNMVNRVRRARTGRTIQAPSINPMKALPA